jgi:hypothetical protein
MTNHEQAVRDAAAALKTAIADATLAGYRIEWPSNAAALDLIAISETSAVQAAEAPAQEAVVKVPPARND